LESLDEKYMDRKKFQFLTRHLLVVGLTDWMVGHCDSNYMGLDESFRNSCKWLRSKDAQSNYSSSHKASRKARITKTENDTVNEQSDLDFLAMYMNANYNNSSRGFNGRERLDVPFLLWKLFDPSTQKVIRDTRDNHNNRGKGGGNLVPGAKNEDNKGNGNKESNIIPWRYGNPADRASNKMHQEKPTQADKDGQKTPTEDPDEANEYELWTKLMNTVKDMTVEDLYDSFGERQAKMAITVIKDDDEMDIRVHTDFYDVIARLVKGTNLNVSTSDNGADTCVVGNGWKIVIKTARRANLVGFDSNYARKKGLPIVTADTVVRLQDQSEVIIMAHETVYNEGSPTTLISEFQVRTHGLVLDSVHKNHTASQDGRKGSQAFYLTEDNFIPLEMKGGLMTFENREPTEEDYKNFEVYEITGSNQWNPQRFYDDSAAIEPLSKTITRGFKSNTETPSQANYQKQEGNIVELIDEEDGFYDSISENDEYYWYSSDTFSTKVMKTTVSDDELTFFDTSDDFSEKSRLGKAFHLTIDYDSFETMRDEEHHFIRDTSVNHVLQEMTLEELYGFIPSPNNFDTYA
jgi:hypothetical protein